MQWEKVSKDTHSRSMSFASPSKHEEFNWSRTSRMVEKLVLESEAASHHLKRVAVYEKAELETITIKNTSMKCTHNRSMRFPSLSKHNQIGREHPHV
jgi:hypothetical protein